MGLEGPEHGTFAALSNPLATCRTAQDIAQDVGVAFLIGTPSPGVAVSHIIQHVIRFVMRQILLTAELADRRRRGARLQSARTVMQPTCQW